MKKQFDIMKNGLNGLDEFIEELEKIMIDVNIGTIDYMANHGVNIIQQSALNNVGYVEDEKDLSACINGNRIESVSMGIVSSVSFINDTQDATYVEYGTGIVGKNSSRHPRPIITGWKHDVDSKAKQEDRGWYFRKIKHYGMPSQPFMYRASQDMRKIVVKKFRELLRTRMNMR